MFDILRDFINGLSDEGGRHKSPRDNPDVAAVALFFSVIGADGEVTAAERAMLRDLVAKDYSDSEAELKELLSEAEAADRDSVDLYAFTSVLNWKLTPEEKVRFIELLWELAYADGVRHELEDHVVWRIADLMGVDSRDRVFARQRVAERRGITGENEA
jgi:uncharacterized tellurite resistance protein B-like protein